MNRIHSPSCGPDLPPDLRSNLDVNRSIYWVFAGSVFGGMRGPLLHFAELAREKCMQLLFDQHHLMWEVNVWVLLMREHSDLFSLYPSAHDGTILANW
jgi:hypothetical protein